MQMTITIQNTGRVFFKHTPHTPRVGETVTVTYAHRRSASGIVERVEYDFTDQDEPHVEVIARKIG